MGNFIEFEVIADTFNDLKKGDKFKAAGYHKSYLEQNKLAKEVVDNSKKEDSKKQKKDTKSNKTK